MNNQKEVMGFHFTKIPLREALASIRSSGKFGEMKNQLLEILPSIEEANQGVPESEQQAFAFGFPKGRKEMDEKEKRSLLMVINGFLRKSGISWKVAYSTSRKLFICAPVFSNTKARRVSRGPRGPYLGKANPAYSKIKDLWESGMSPRKIALKLNEPYQRVQYVCYQVYPKNKPNGGNK